MFNNDINPRFFRTGDFSYQAYAESHESDPPEISDGFKELEDFLCTLPLDDNNAVFNLCCRLCSAYEREAFIDGLQYGASLLNEIKYLQKHLIVADAVQVFLLISWHYAHINVEQLS